MAESRKLPGTRPGEEEQQQGSDRPLPWVAGPVFFHDHDHDHDHYDEAAKPGGSLGRGGRVEPVIAKQMNDSDYGILKLFFDLWFVANLQVFTSVKDVSKSDDLYNYIGFLTILWFTWFLVGAFDIRFSQDSIFDRTIRTVHLGVLVGFSIVIMHFYPENQDNGIFQALSWVMMVSRLTLATQYFLVFVYVRHYERGKFPVLATAAVHFVAAMIYLGISFRFDPWHNSRVFVVWYLGSFLEAVLVLGLSYRTNVLSFDRTPAAERLTVLTVILLGEGVTDIAESVALIVKNGRWWTPPTIGVLISAVAALYFVFMIYFDWMEREGLKGLRQLFYMLLHFPFHICLLLMGVGSTQFLRWWKAIEVNKLADEEIRRAIEGMNISHTYANASEWVADTLQNKSEDIFKNYRPTWHDTTKRLDQLFADIKGIPVEYWNSTDTNEALNARVEQDIVEFLYTISNSLFASFKIDPIREMVNRNETRSTTQKEVYREIGIHYAAVYRYTFACAGTVLLLMVTLHVLTKRRWPWPLHHVRVLLSSLLGLGLISVSMLDRQFVDRNEGLYAQGTFRGSPWPLPTICLVFFAVVVVTHLRAPSSPSSSWCGFVARLRRKPRKADEADEDEGVRKRPREDPRGAYKGLADEESSIASDGDFRLRRGQTM